MPSIAAQGTSLRRDSGSRFRTRSERTEVTPGSNPSYTFTAGESAKYRRPRPPLLLECQPPGAAREGQPRPPHPVLVPHQVLCTLHHHLLIQHRLQCQRYGGDLIEKAKQTTANTFVESSKRQVDISELNIRDIQLFKSGVLTALIIKSFQALHLENLSEVLV